MLESDSDYDELLEVKEITDHEKRGRRRTREEDDMERDTLARKEAEMRSLSKKSKKSSSAHGTPVSADIPPSPRVIPQAVAASLAGVLNGDSSGALVSLGMLSPGLPSSPPTDDGSAAVAASLTTAVAPRAGRFPCCSSVPTATSTAYSSAAQYASPDAVAHRDGAI